MKVLDFAIPLLSLAGIADAQAYGYGYRNTKTQKSQPTQVRCSADTCAKAVTGVNGNGRPQATQLADCSSYLRHTVIPAPTTTTITTTVTKAGTTVQKTEVVTKFLTQATTVTLDATTTQTMTKMLQKRGSVTKSPGLTIVVPSSVPRYASSCAGPGRYSSACNCIGVHPTTITAKRQTVTKTQTVTATRPAKTNIATLSTTVVKKQTKTITNHVTATVDSFACKNTVLTDEYLGHKWNVKCGDASVGENSDIIGQVTDVGFNECFRRCDPETHCKFVNYHIPLRVCTLFSTAPTRIGPSADFVTIQDTTPVDDGGDGGNGNGNTETCKTESIQDSFRKDTWQITCGNTLVGISGNSLLTTAKTINECFNACAQYPDCKFANYEMNSGTCEQFKIYSSGSSAAASNYVSIEDTTAKNNQNSNGNVDTCKSETVTDEDRGHPWEIKCGNILAGVTGSRSLRTATSIQGCLQECSRTNDCKFANYDMASGVCEIYSKISFASSSASSTSVSIEDMVDKDKYTCNAGSVQSSVNQHEYEIVCDTKRTPDASTLIAYGQEGTAEDCRERCMNVIAGCELAVYEMSTGNCDYYNAVTGANERADGWAIVVDTEAQTQGGGNQ